MIITVGFNLTNSHVDIHRQLCNLGTKIASKILNLPILINMGIIFPHKAKVISVTTLNHNVILLKITKPWKFDFKIGQAVDFSIDKSGYELAVAPFTLANVPTDMHLEFVIKVYDNPKALTQGIAKLQPGDTIQLSSAWDSYFYKGKGTFIAAGTGITPFFANLQKPV